MVWLHWFYALVPQLNNLILNDCITTNMDSPAATPAPAPNIAAPPAPVAACEAAPAAPAAPASNAIWLSFMGSEESVSGIDRNAAIKSKPHGCACEGVGDFVELWH